MTATRFLHCTSGACAQGSNDGVIHFQAIPDAINTVSEQTCHFSSQARGCSLGKWRGFVTLYQFMFFKLPVFILLIYLENLSLRWASLMCQGLFDITNSCTEYAYKVKGEILTGVEFWWNTFWSESRQLSCRPTAQSKQYWNVLLGGQCWLSGILSLDISNKM